ncbi:centrosomal protein of 295 kDa [Spea bombifrons]|uniref:centrosomal protein of 295 kDa n=1 Tax=Spea bombifrons TaxID=233779 RepID=UPI00234B881C|nr:centrosomal protein of 295 kDa [Spea bombifrons]
MYTEKMKRKVAKASTLRLSPNEESLLLKQERERRRKLRLQQVREQEKVIAQQIRNNVKDRRDQQLQHLAEELRAHWQATQDEKLQALEKAYQSSVRAIGESHRQAKENEPDLKAIERRVAANKEKAEKRHREALRELKQHKEEQLKEQMWHIKARRKALNIEKERAAKIASLPPPPPDPLENLELVKKLPSVKLCNIDSFSVSHYHLPEPYVDREMDREQPDARASAVEEAKRLDALQKEEEREKMEQLEKAHLRGSHALKMVHLTQDRDRLLKELEQMQQNDLVRRRHIVAHMPQQLFEPAYRRAEIMEERQRELESAFEDMYTQGQQVKGDLVLQLKPQPLPVPSVKSTDEDLDLSMDPEHASEVSGNTEEVIAIDKPQAEAREPQSRVALKKLLHRIRTQKDKWSSKSDIETLSETLESGSLPVEEEEEPKVKLISESQEKDEPPEPEPQDETVDNTVLAGNAILLHPQEHAMRIRMTAERQKEMEDIERQKQEQLQLLERLEEQRRSLEAELLKVKHEMEEAKRQEKEEADDSPAQVSAPEVVSSTESPHIQMIREYQQRLIQQNRKHKQSVEDARKRLQEYQLLLKKRYSHLSTSGPQAEIQTGADVRSSTITETNEKSIERFTSSETRPRLQPASGQLVDVTEQTLGPLTPTTLQNLGQTVLQRTQPSPFVLSEIPNNGFGQLREQAMYASSSSSDTLTEQTLVGAQSLGKIKSPKRVGTSTNVDFEESRDPHENITFKETECPSPEESEVKAQDGSSTSSLWEHDSSSDQFYALPPALSLGLPQIQPECLPDAAKPSVVPQPYTKEKVGWSFGEFSSVQEFRERLLSSTSEIQLQQDQLREKQRQLDKQRESLLSKQKSQEEELLQKQKALEEQMRKHQESLEHYLSGAESGPRTLPQDLCQVPVGERYHLMSSLLEALQGNGEQHVVLGNGGVLKALGRDHRWRPSKPPVTKTKLGPMLEPHELSAILEVDTPTSGRHSSDGLAVPRESRSGLKDRPGGEDFLAPFGYNPESSRITSSSSSDSFIRHLDLSGISLSSGSSSSQRSRSKLSWREILSLEASSSHDQDAGHSQTSDSQRDLSSPPPPETSFPKPLRVHETPRFADAAQIRPEAPSSPRVLALEPFHDYLSTTTISTGSFLTSENADSSPGVSEYMSELQRCNFSLIREASEASPPTVHPSALHRTNGSRRSEFSPSAQENRSQIHQIIEKYTKDLSASLERNLSFHAPASAVDISATEGNQHSMVFHPLDPKPDFNISTPSYALSNDSSSSPDNKPFSQTSSSSQVSLSQNRDQSGRSSSGLGSSPSVEFVTGSSTKNPILGTSDSSASFHALHPECTFNETNPFAQEERSSRCSVLGLDSTKSTTVMQGDVSTSQRYNPRPPAFQCSTQIIMGQDQSIAEGSGSFHTLVATQTSVNDSVLSEHPVSESLEKQDEVSRRFEELPAEVKLLHVADNTESYNVQNYEKSGGFGPAGRSPRPGKGAGVSPESSNQTLYSEIITDGSHTRSSVNLSLLPSFTSGSTAFSLASRVSEWDTDSACGIMEEPELTLVSLNDSSVLSLEPVLTKTTTSDHQGDQNSSESGFYPLTAEMDASRFTVTDGSFLGLANTNLSLSQPFTEISIEKTPAPGNLQDAFLTKKRLFVERSTKRLEEIKQKGKPQETNVKSPRDLPLINPPEASVGAASVAPADGGQLKRVTEVRVCTPEERKLTELEMHQRTMRLYNQLDEVKTKKETIVREKAYAKNREKAKEFKKKTLEKLRANKK